VPGRTRSGPLPQRGEDIASATDVSHLRRRGRRDARTAGDRERAQRRPVVDEVGEGRSRPWRCDRAIRSSRYATREARTTRRSFDAFLLVPWRRPARACVPSAAAWPFYLAPGDVVALHPGCHHRRRALRRTRRRRDTCAVCLASKSRRARATAAPTQSGSSSMRPRAALRGGGREVPDLVRRTAPTVASSVSGPTTPLSVLRCRRSSVTPVARATFAAASVAVTLVTPQCPFTRGMLASARCEAGVATVVDALRAVAIDGGRPPRRLLRAGGAANRDNAGPTTRGRRLRPMTSATA